MKLEEAINLYVQARCGEIADSTLTWYQHHLRAMFQYLGNVDIAEITITDLRAYRAKLLEQENRWLDHPTRPTEGGGLSPYSIHNRIQTCKQFFSWLVEESLLDGDPSERLKQRKLPDEPPKAISPEDLAAMIDAAETTRDRALILVMADTASRVQGIADLKLEDVDVKRGTLLIHTKGNKTLEVYLTEEPLEALRKWLRERPLNDGTDAVFTSRVHGRGLTTNGIYQVFKRLAKKANVERRYNPHALRHAAARSMLDSGADLGIVSQILGHANIHVTVRFYARWTRKELKQHHQRHSPVRNLRKKKQ